METPGQVWVEFNMIELNERGDKRLWADLEAAYAFIRKSGYTQVIEIDG
jgi:hypothetical protein